MTRDVWRLLLSFTGGVIACGLFVVAIPARNVPDIPENELKRLLDEVASFHEDNNKIVVRQVIDGILSTQELANKKLSGQIVEALMPKQETSQSELVKQIVDGVTSFQASSKSEASASTARQIAENAVALENEGDLEKAQYMREVAFTRARQKPEEFSGLWQFYCELVKSSGAENGMVSDYISDEIDQSLLGTSDVSTFETLWAIREEIAKTSEASNQLDLNGLTAIVERSESANLDECCLMITGGASKEAVYRPLGDVLLGLFPDNSVDPILETQNSSVEVAQKKLEEFLIRVTDKFSQELKVIEDGYLQLSELDKKGQFREPSESPKLGRYAEELNEIAKLEQTWIALNLTYYVALASQESIAKLSEELQSIQARLQVLPSRCAESQNLAYNLWALNRLQLAENSPEGGGIVGMVDIRFLHPTVSSLYSTVYSSLLENNRDPNSRRNLIQNILNGKKVMMEQF